MRDDRDRLQDILDAVEAIRSRCGSDRTPFDGDEVWAAVDRDVDPLAESIRRILGQDGDVPDRV